MRRNKGNKKKGEGGEVSGWGGGGEGGGVGEKEKVVRRENYLISETNFSLPIELATVEDCLA